MSFEIANGFSIINPKLKKRNFYNIGTRTLKPNAVNSSECLLQVANRVIKSCSGIPEESIVFMFSVTECGFVVLNQILSPWRWRQHIPQNFGNDSTTLCKIPRNYGHYKTTAVKPWKPTQNTVFFWFNPLKPELNPIFYLLALLGAHHFLHVCRIRVKLLTFRRLMSYIYISSTHSWFF